MGYRNVFHIRERHWRKKNPTKINFINLLNLLKAEFSEMVLENGPNRSLEYFNS